MISNYEITKKKTQSEFLKYDQEEMIRRFHLAADEDYLYFPFLGRECRVGRKDGIVECAENGVFQEAGFNEALTVCDLLCWAKPEAAPSGEYVIMQSLSPLMTSSVGLGGKSFYEREARLFDHHPEALSAAFRALHGEEAAGGDVSAFIAVFDGLKARVRFWNSDDEFGPEIQVFWDKNVLLYMHYETVWYAVGALMSRIREEFSRAMRTSEDT